MSGICDTCKRDECYMQHDGDDSCPLYIKGKPSNYKKLFGTPERAARTMIEMCRESTDCGACAGCPFLSSGIDCNDDAAMLEWLRGDAE